MGFEGLEQLLTSMPDAVRWEDDRLVGMREATRHEVATWALTQNGVVSDDATFVSGSRHRLNKGRCIQRLERGVPLPARILRALCGVG